jgi:hypothetical protein
MNELAVVDKGADWCRLMTPLDSVSFHADAFVLTFARPVAPPEPEYHPRPKRGPNVYDWAQL